MILKISFCPERCACFHNKISNIFISHFVHIGTSRNNNNLDIVLLISQRPLLGHQRWYNKEQKPMLNKVINFSHMQYP